VKLIAHAVDPSFPRCTLCNGPGPVQECQLPYGPPGPQAKFTKTWPVRSQWWILCARCISVIEGLDKPYVTLEVPLKDEIAL
jgi:hypothetical protein